MKSLKVGGREIGPGSPVFLIAELSANHGSRRDVALRSVEAAARAGADAVKLQTYTPDTLTLCSRAERFVVQTKNAWAGRTLHDLYAEAMTPWEWHAELKAATESFGMTFFSTPFDVSAVEYLEDLGVLLHKIASFELTDLPLVEHVARRGKPMILSTGMATLGEIEAAVQTCRAVGNEQLALLRCVSAYPAEPAAMGLASYSALASFGAVIGLSDHTRDATAAIASVALGAKIIEKHFIVDRAIGGPDSFFSLDPDEFAFLVRSVRDAEAAVGRPRFGPAADEVTSLRFRRSLFVTKPVRAGELLTCSNVRSVRPADGIPARHLPEVLGRPSTRDLEEAAPLSWSDVGPAAPLRVSLRRATSDDAAFLLEVRNDETTRAMSKSTVVVAASEHASWLASVQADADCALFVVEREGHAVGQVRLDQHGAVAEVSVALAASARGNGYAVDALRACERVARERGVVLLEAVIREQNERSREAFRRAGYYAFRGTDFIRCERHIG